MQYNDTLVIIPGDKDSCEIILDKVDYVTKMEEMIKKWHTKGSLCGNWRQHIMGLETFSRFSLPKI